MTHVLLTILIILPQAQPEEDYRHLVTPELLRHFGGRGDELEVNVSVQTEDPFVEANALNQKDINHLMATQARMKADIDAMRAELADLRAMLKALQPMLQQTNDWAGEQTYSLSAASVPQYRYVTRTVYQQPQSYSMPPMAMYSPMATYSMPVVYSRPPRVPLINISPSFYRSAPAVNVRSSGL